MELTQEQQKALAKIRDDWEIINEYDRGAGVGISGQQRVARTLLDIIDTLQAQPPAPVSSATFDPQYDWDEKRRNWYRKDE